MPPGRHLTGKPRPPASADSAMEVLVAVYAVLVAGVIALVQVSPRPDDH